MDFFDPDGRMDILSVAIEFPPWQSRKSGP